MTLYSREYDFIYFYITLFKALDPRVAFLLEHAETLVAAGLLSIDDVAKYINNVTVITAEKAATILSSMSSSTASSILANPNLSADKTQSILYSMAFSSKLVDILTSGASNWTVTSNTTISGVNRYYSLTVNSGVTLSIGGQPGILIVKNLYCYGTIAKTATGGAGGSASSGAGPGGTGGGGLIIFTDYLINSGVISADGNAGGAGGNAPVLASGGAGGSGYYCTVLGDSFGTGGNGGGSGGGAGGINGGGGGGHSSAPGGSGDGSSYGSYDFISLAETIRKATIDWVIKNVYGKNPTNTVNFINAYGSGGGGGGIYSGTCGGGGGGGGGGEVIVMCTSANNLGTIRANGGNGGNGGNAGSYDAGGGGGGGGIVYVLCKYIQNTGTLVALGGSGGIGDYNGSAGSAGVTRIVSI
jgi:hypothetical protein